MEFAQTITLFIFGMVVTAVFFYFVGHIAGYDEMTRFCTQIIQHST